VTDAWRHTFGTIGFTPHGKLGAMRMMIEDVEYVATPHPWKGLAIVVTHTSARTAAQFEHFVPSNASAVQVAEVMVRAYEQVHPERRSGPASASALLERGQLMERDATYKEFRVMAKPLQLVGGEWNTQVHLMRGNAVKAFYASNTWKTEADAVRGCLEFGRRIIDEEIPGIGPGDLP
jgi:hypothetical protein